MAAGLSRRRLMYAIVGLQALVLGVIVVSEELNIGLDRGPSVDLDIAQARARKDPFRGASVFGDSAIDLDGRTVPVQPARLQPGDKVLVVFAVEAGRRPRIISVERRRQGDPPFSATRFSIPGTVLGKGDDRPFAPRHGGLVARVGDPAVPIELALPGSIPIDDSGLGRFAGPSLVRASLHRGFLGRRYLSDVRLIGRGWTREVSFVYDEGRQRLVVLSPRESMSAGPGAEVKPRTDVFFFDALGQPIGTVDVPGRVIEAGAHAGNGDLLALVSDEPWGLAQVSLARIRSDGQVLQRSAPIAYERIVGFDGATGGVWRLSGLAASQQRGPHFVERMTLETPQEPRLGPFTSAPRMVYSDGGQVWVVETGQHRVVRLDVATGRALLEYRDLNDPTLIAADSGSLYVIEANRTQVTKFSEDGRVLWRVPRFSGLAWIIPEHGTGAGWLGAATFEGRAAGVLRFGPEGTISRVGAGTDPFRREDWRRQRVGRDAFLSVSGRRLYVLEGHAIAILGADGELLKRVDGFPSDSEERLRR